MGLAKILEAKISGRKIGNISNRESSEEMKQAGNCSRPLGMCWAFYSESRRRVETSNRPGDNFCKY